MPNLIAETIPLPGARFTLTPAVAGTLIILLIELAFALIGSGIGFAFFTAAPGEMPLPWVIGAGVFGTIGMLLSAWTGGYVAARLAHSSTRWESIIHGICAYAIASLAVALFIAGSATLSMSRAFMAAGMGGGNSHGVAQAILEQLSDARIVTDYETLEGKQITQLVLPRTNAADALNETLEDAGAGNQWVPTEPEIQAEVRDVGPQVRKAGVITNFMSLGILCLGVLAAAMGGRVGGKPSYSPRGPDSRAFVDDEEETEFQEAA